MPRPARARGLPWRELPGGVAARLADLALVAGLTSACHPPVPFQPSVRAVTWVLPLRGPWPGRPLLAASTDAGANPAPVAIAPAGPGTLARAAPVGLDVDALVVGLYRAEGLSLVRLARLFVDDRNAAEDLVQEAFIRLARSADRIRDRDKAAAYLRSIVLNLARDHNRRGLVSLRHQLPLLEPSAAAADEDLELREDQREVLDALRELPRQQRNCVALRHLEERSVAEVAGVLGISENSVKTHLKRGMAALALRLGEPT
ncbi:MAG: RNA polymerase sigma factor [Acidimicrobiia bacterium]